jgi:CRP/FNR family transcriptional regulator
MFSASGFEPSARAVALVPAPEPAAGAHLAPARPARAPAGACSNCHLRDMCLPCGLPESDVKRLDNQHFALRKVAAGQALYRQGDRFEQVYAVRSGTLKSTLTLADGREQVSAFYMAGEQLGLDGLAHGQHVSSAIALEDTVVCAIPFGALAALANTASMQHLLARMMSREIVREHGLMLLLGSMGAKERLAVFLLNLAQRLKARGYSALEFHMRMTRAEIGSHLGLKLETVSRTLSAFARRRWLQVDKRHIRILDEAALASLIETRMV